MALRSVESLRIAATMMTLEGLDLAARRSAKAMSLGLCLTATRAYAMHLWHAIANKSNAPRQPPHPHLSPPALEDVRCTWCRSYCR